MGLDLDSLASSAMTQDEAVEKPNLARVLVWADPGHGKSHFSYTMPDPVCIIDTEGKAHEITHKFDGTDHEDDPFLWQPENYDEALAALHEALDVLHAFEDEYGVKGTIVVDSMSIMWEWSQQKYIEEYYPDSDPEDVQLSAGFGGGQSDWQKIKEYHNDKFRAVMETCDFHVCWTAMREEDYSAKLEENLNETPYKPSGEKNNVYKVNTIIRVERGGDDGKPLGILEKSGLVKYRYSGLEYPTYEKHAEVMDHLQEVEDGTMDIADVEAIHDIAVFEGDPQYQD